jgi:hypothetical protein
LTGAIRLAEVSSSDAAAPPSPRALDANTV